MNYKYKEIDKIYTNIVTDYLSNGYTIYTPCMAGHQGEIVKVVLSKSKDELICVYMDKERGEEIGKIIIVVGKYKHNNYGYIRNNDTLWLNKLEEIKKITFYEINDCKNGYYTDSFDFLIECKEKRLKRSCLRRKVRKTKPVELKSKRAIEIALKHCKQTRGYKMVKPKDILSIIKENNKFYRIKINNKDDLIIKF